MSTPWTEALPAALEKARQEKEQAGKPPPGDWSVSVGISVPVTVDQDGNVTFGAPYGDDSFVYSDLEVYDNNLDNWHEASEFEDGPLWQIFDEALGLPEGRLAQAVKDAEVLDRIADLFRLPEWNIGGSMADLLDCVADALRPVRDISTPAPVELLRQAGYEAEAEALLSAGCPGCASPEDVDHEAPCSMAEPEIDEDLAREHAEDGPDPEPCAQCDGGIVPGVLWPMASNGDDDHDWIERCDDCAVFEGDHDAAEALSAVLRTPYQEATPYGSERPHPYIDRAETPPRKD